MGETTAERLRNLFETWSHQFGTRWEYTLGPGLTDVQMRRVQERYDLRFPPDLVELFSELVPLGPRFYDWADETPENVAHIRGMIGWPVEGVLFDVENNAVWLPEWGERPAQKEDAIALAAEHLGTAPHLVPLMGHRYLPTEPCKSGNPVFSIYQTDMIVYGRDLNDYFHNELGGSRTSDMSNIWAEPQEPLLAAIRAVPVWGQFVLENEFWTGDDSDEAPLHLEQRQLKDLDH